MLPNDVATLKDLGTNTTAALELSESTLLNFLRHGLLTLGCCLGYLRLWCDAERWSARLSILLESICLQRRRTFMTTSEPLIPSGGTPTHSPLNSLSLFFSMRPGFACDSPASCTVYYWLAIQHRDQHVCFHRPGSLYGMDDVLYLRYPCHRNCFRRQSLPTAHHQLALCSPLFAFYPLMGYVARAQYARSTTTGFGLVWDGHPQASLTSMSAAHDGHP